MSGPSIVCGRRRGEFARRACSGLQANACIASTEMKSQRGIQNPKGGQLNRYQTQEAPQIGILRRSGGSCSGVAFSRYISGMRSSRLRTFALVCLVLPGLVVQLRVLAHPCCEWDTPEESLVDESSCCCNHSESPADPDSPPCNEQDDKVPGKCDCDGCKCSCARYAPVDVDTDKAVARRMAVVHGAIEPEGLSDQLSAGPLLRPPQT